MTADLTTITRALAEHAYRGGWLANSGGFMHPGERAGRWSCACGAGGPLNRGERILHAHRAHLAAVLAATHDADIAAAESRGAERGWDEGWLVGNEYVCELECGTSAGAAKFAAETNPYRADKKADRG